ncbi:MAG: dTDP-4-dehydrorhamnose reductase [Desulfatitalea sp.]|nr:dTDP-4-dehydrorhamnose reductase [Desulfatitalea sp.]
MRILITGSNGQLGHDLMEQARSRDWQAVGADLPQCDITNGDSVAAALAAAGSPAAVINAAAYTAVDAAEGDPATAYAVNRDGVATLARICREHQVPLIHVSTDYVFDGLKTSPYRPTDPIRPSGVYGHSKAEGETLLRAQWEQHVIVRTSWLFGRHGGNFVKTMLRLGRERDTLRVVDDQVGCPTYAGDLAGALLEIAAHVTRNGQGWGTYHFCNDPAVTWWAFTRRIIALARTHERLAVTDIVPILTVHYPLPAPRPPYSVLDCGTLESQFGITRRSWEEGLKEMLADMDGVG